MSKKRKVVKLLQEEEDLLLTAASLQLQIHINQTEDKKKKKKKKKKKRSVWAKDWLQRRVLYGQCEKLIVELREEDSRGYKNYMRISSELFRRRRDTSVAYS